MFDTVGSIGLPQEIQPRAAPLISPFGFSNDDLGEHVEYAFQALALDEARVDFKPIKWTQTPAGAAKGQVLRQCWFAGSHSDIGGGWEVHDLADLTLAWMTAQTMDLFKYDLAYIEGIPDCTFPWGEQPPHNSDTGVFSLALTTPRTPPTAFDPITQEFVHESVTRQPLSDETATAVTDESLLLPLLPFEARIKEHWNCVPGCHPRKAKKSLAQLHKQGRLHLSELLGFGRAKKAGLLGRIELGQLPPVLQNAVSWVEVELANVGARIAWLFGRRPKSE